MHPHELRNFGARTGLTLPRQQAPSTLVSSAPIPQWRLTGPYLGFAPLNFPSGLKVSGDSHDDEREPHEKQHPDPGLRVVVCPPDQASDYAYTGKRVGDFDFFLLTREEVSLVDIELALDFDITLLCRRSSPQGGR